MINDRENGFVCNSVNEFIEAIDKSKSHESDNYIMKAYDDILYKFSTEVQVKEYKRIYSNYMKC